MMRSYSLRPALFALILPLLSSANSGHAGEASFPAASSSPVPAVAAINPYMALAGCHDAPDETRAWHAFVLLGTETFFASHITNLCMEIHKYQLIIEISLPQPYQSTLIEERRRHPADSYFISNLFPDASIGSGSDPMNLPELASALRTSLIANVWRGIPNKPVYDHWPWQGVRPVLSNVPVTVKRIVFFEPFSHSMNHPDRLSYLLFGSGSEAHLVHLQTMHDSEPDYDQVATLREPPKWLPTDLLEAGAVIDLPDKPRFGNEEDKARGVRCASPFENGEEVEVRYRGTDQRRITIGANKWFCTRIANDPDPCQEVNERACGSGTPEE